MEKCIFIVLVSLFTCDLYSYDTFLCIDGPLRIRKEPNIQSERIGIMNTYEVALIIEKTNNLVQIDNISDYWYKIRKGTVDGYVFGGYGIEVKEQYEVRTIDDMVKVFPKEFNVFEFRRNCYERNGKYIVLLHYGAEFLNHPFEIRIFFNPLKGINENDLVKRFNLHLLWDSSIPWGNFPDGEGQERYNDAASKYGNGFKYWFLDVGSGISKDAANFLLNEKINDIFDGVLINMIDPYIYENDKYVGINNESVFQEKTHGKKNVLIHIIVYELAQRMKFIN
jgi:hypothetical protein